MKSQAMALCCRRSSGGGLGRGRGGLLRRGGSRWRAGRRVSIKEKTIQWDRSGSTYVVEVLCHREDSSSGLEEEFQAIMLVVTDVDAAVVECTKDLLPGLIFMVSLSVIVEYWNSDSPAQIARPHAHSH